MAKEGKTEEKFVRGRARSRFLSPSSRIPSFLLKYKKDDRINPVIL